MQNLDNNMDELFKKAADNYPLKTNTGNFDDLLPLIGSETATTTITPALRRSKRKTTLLLLAFLIMGLTIGTTYLITKSSNDLTIKTNAPFTEKLIPPGKNNTTPALNINMDAADPIPAKAPTENGSSLLATNYQKNKLTSFTNGKGSSTIISYAAETGEVSKKITDVNRSTSVDNTATDHILNQPEANNNIVATKDKQDNIDITGKTKEIIVDETKAVDIKDKKNKSKKPALYYGVAAGVEFNEVKNQPMTKAGLNGAVVLGVQLSATTSIETGVQLSQKKYYSDGKYFKPKAGSMPANMAINSLQSTSTIIEIPVSVKYNFSKKKNTLYGKAGVSTYILTKESNKYQAVVSGQQEEINSTYKDNHSYFASDLRISAGYQHTVTKKLNIRVEPYVQIPIKGIGVGNMPVTTAGLQVVLIRN